jgi:glutaryl-CoA dehydrogenase
MARYEGVDFYNIDDLLSEEERAVRDTVRGWVGERVLPIIEKHYENGTFPHELAKEMGELGFLGANLKGYGCPGLSNVMYGLICQELEAGDSAIRSFAFGAGLARDVPHPRVRVRGAEEQVAPAARRRGGDRLLRPDRARLRQQPRRNDHPRRRQGHHYLLNGAKMWITNGTVADVAVVWAKLDGVVRGFLVEKGMPGFSAPEMKGKHSLRASVTSELVFQDVKLPKENLLPGVSGPQGPALVPEQRALRHRVGRARRRAGVLRLRERVLALAHPVRPPDRQLPARAEQARLDAP